MPLSLLPHSWKNIVLKAIHSRLHTGKNLINWQLAQQLISSDRVKLQSMITYKRFI